MKVLNIQVNYLCYVGAHRRDWWFFNYRLMRGDHNSHYTKDIRALAKGPFKYKFDKLIQPVSYQILRWFGRLLNGRLEKAVFASFGRGTGCKITSILEKIQAANLQQQWLPYLQLQLSLLPMLNCIMGRVVQDWT